MRDPAERQRLWNRYMQVEHRELEDRKGGELARVLGPALPGESREEIDRLAREDREKAEEGFVWLQKGEEVWEKHIENLTREDRPARIEAQRRRLAWAKERLGRARGAGEQTEPETEHAAKTEVETRVETETQTGARGRRREEDAR